jgi:hypothetical protein
VPVGVGLVGGVLLVVYVEPFADRVTHSAWTYVLLPVPPAPVEHPTTHSVVPPFGTLAPERGPMSWATVPSSVPLNGAVTLATVGEMLLAGSPAGVRMYSTADVWKAVGHGVVVDQVGVRLVAPLAGWRASWPGPLPVTACAAAAVNSPAPAVRPSTPRSTSHLTFASRREPPTTRITDIAAHDMAQTANSGRTSGEN